MNDKPDKKDTKKLSDAEVKALQAKKQKVVNNQQVVNK